MIGMTVEQAKDLKHSILWDALCGDITIKIEAAKERLVVCSPNELFQLQADIRALRGLLTLPQDVIDKE